MRVAHFAIGFGAEPGAVRAEIRLDSPLGAGYRA